MTPLIQSNAREFNAAFRQYLALTSLTPAESVLKQTAEFSRYLHNRLRSLAPAKGAIRAERMAALAAGEGVKVRAQIVERLMQRRGIAQKIKGRGYVFGKAQRGTVRSRGKRLNFQALAVRAEINLRERGRGFIGQSARFKPLVDKMRADGSGKQRATILDRYRRYLSSAGFTINRNGAQGVLAWGGNASSGEVAKVLQQQRGQEAVANALADARENMMVYVRRKLAQNAAQTLGRVR